MGNESEDKKEKVEKVSYYRKTGERKIETSNLEWFSFIGTYSIKGSLLPLYAPAIDDVFQGEKKRKAFD